MSTKIFVDFDIVDEYFDSTAAIWVTCCKQLNTFPPANVETKFVYFCGMPWQEAILLKKFSHIYTLCLCLRFSHFTIVSLVV